MRLRVLLAVALVLAGVLVWLLLTGRDRPARERSAPRREAPVAEETGPARTEAPEPASKGSAEGKEPAAAPAPAAAKDAGVRVRVLAEGRAVADAHVYVTPEDGGAEEAKREEGADTYFAAETGDVTVSAAHARLGPARKQVQAPEGKVTEVTLELPAGETLDLLVVADKGGAPVAGASVLVLRAGGPALDGHNTGIEDPFDADDPEKVDFSILGTIDFADFMLLEGAPSVAIPRLTTDAEGRVRVTGLPRGTVDIVVAHPDFVATRLRNKPVGKEAVARLSAGGSLTVLPPYVEGRAAEGYLCGAIRPGLMLSLPVASVRVDSEGKAFFAHLPPGPLHIVVAKAKHPFSMMALAMGGYASETEDLPAEEPAEGEASRPQRGSENEVRKFAEGNVTIVSGAMKTLDLRETKGARVEGVFVMGDKPQENALVLLLSGERQIALQRTGETGKFAFEGVAPGKYRVTVTGGIGTIARADVEVKEGDTVVTVRIDVPVGSIAGRILGPDGKPAAKGRAVVVPREGGRGQARNLIEIIEELGGLAEADEEGRFVVAGVPAGEYRVLGAVGKRLDVVHVTLREGETAQVELRVDAARLRRLLVKLEGADGKPVEGSVNVLGADGGVAEMLAVMDEEEEMPGSGKTSATHEFFLAPGRYRLVAGAPGLASSLGEAVDISGDKDLTVTLGAGVHVEITLEGPDGALANREVDVRNQHGIRLCGHSAFEILLGGAGLRTDGGGILALDAVPPGRYGVHVDGKEAGSFDVGSSPVTKRLRVE